MKLTDKFKIQTYNIGIIRKDIRSVLVNGISGGEIQWLRHKYRDRFFADPFLISRNETQLFILVEELPFKTEKGIISLLTVNKDKFELVSKKTIIEEPWHLSFPFCKENGDTIIPEAVASGKTYKYFLNKESFDVNRREVISNDGMIDAVFFEKDGAELALASKKEAPKLNLFSYKRKDDLYEIINDGKPIVESISYSRNAGKLFTVDGQCYRPTQDCKNRYGEETCIMKVDDISENKLSENLVRVVNSFENPPYSETMHTFNVYDSFIIVDGSKDYIRFPTKAFYKLCCHIKKNAGKLKYEN